MAKKIDCLSPDELKDELDYVYYVPGRPYLFVMGFGWAIVAFYVKHETPLTIRVAHANHFRDARKDYGRLIMEGGDPGTEWRYEGRDLLSVPSIQRVSIYKGEVPRGPIIRT